MGCWDGTPEIAYAFSWSLCNAHGDDCQTADGQDGSRLDISSDMEGTTVKATVTATNAAASVAATTAPSKVVGSFTAA